jgi:hypothetical protein
MSNVYHLALPRKSQSDGLEVVHTPQVACLYNAYTCSCVLVSNVPPTLDTKATACSKRACWSAMCCGCDGNNNNKDEEERSK